MAQPRKDVIIETAARLFAEKGFTETSTAEVAEQAGVAQGTIFYHFKTKEGIFLAVYAKLNEAYAAGMEQARAQAPNGLEGLMAAIRFHFDFGIRRSRELVVIMRDFPRGLCTVGSPHRACIAGHIKPILDVFARCLETGMRDGSIRQVPVEATVHILRGMLYGLSRQRLLGPLDIPVLVNEVIDFCHTALAASPATDSAHA